jgi:hypothetical protein
MTTAVATTRKSAGFAAQSSALLANTALNGVLGITFWLLAGRLASISDVALAIAGSALMILVSVLTQTNLGTALSRFLGAAGGRSRRLVGFSYGVSMLSTMVVVGAMLALAALDHGALLRSSAWTFTLILAISIPLWTAFALQDNVLVAMRKAPWIPIENTAAAILRLILLPFLAGSGASGLFLAYILPCVPAVGVITVLILRNLAPVSAAPGPTGSRAMMGFALIDFPGVLATAAALRIVPILVLQLRGSDQAAFVGLPWTTLTVALLALSQISLALLAELAVPGVDHVAVVRRAHRLILFLVPVCLVGAALVVPLLRVAGAKYASNGTPVLFGGVLALIPAALTEIKIAQLRFAGRVPAATAVQFTRSIPLVTAAAVLSVTNHLAWIGAALVAANALSFLAGRVLLSAHPGRQRRSRRAQELERIAESDA